MEQEQAKFEGWAVIEMMGHRREIGFVTTEYFGGAALFRVDTPEIPEREIVLKRPEWMTVDDTYRQIPAGSTVKRNGSTAKTTFVAPGSLYAMTPCTKETAERAIEEMVPRDYAVIHININEEQRALSNGEAEVDDYEGDCEDDAL